ncbi:MAG TPA: hypothetical protein PLS87_11255 [Ferruginibacter sp.]|nr:hypothetical protein [Ferruginibacter sp.]HRO97644.1 hypothetical protein [Ferruginibacter sp.]
MAKADYTYALREMDGQKFICIIDQDRGNMSVTNNIEEVVDEILTKEKINSADHLIVYRDTDGSWDGWDHDHRAFVHLNSRDQYSSMKNYIKAFSKVY